MHVNVSSSSLQLNQQPGELMILSMHYCSSFCLMHRPTQGVSLKLSSNQTCPICFCQIDCNSKTPFTDIPLVTPCCKMTWFHNSCLQVTRISFLKPDSFPKLILLTREVHIRCAWGKMGRMEHGSLFSSFPSPLLLLSFLSSHTSLVSQERQLGTSQF